MKDQKRALKLFRRLTRKLRIELIRSKAFRLLKKKPRLGDGYYSIIINDDLAFSMNIIGSHVLVMKNASKKGILL